MMSTQAKIIQVVKDYKRLFSQEYQQFVTANKKKNDLQDKFAEVNNSEYVERKIAEYPETLYNLFDSVFERTDWTYLNTKQGIRWFVKRYPEFAGAQKV